MLSGVHLTKKNSLNSGGVKVTQGMMKKWQLYLGTAQ